eukprot:43450-Eustigmatos_ZCMA.PRE.1
MGNIGRHNERPSMSIMWLLRIIMTITRAYASSVHGTMQAAPLLLMPASLATKAFFIGRAVRVLEKTRELKRGWSTRGQSA